MNAVDTLPQAIVLTFMLIALVVSVLASSLFVLWVIRYAKACAADRRREKEYAEAWAKTHRANQNIGRYEYDVPGRPE